MKKILLTCFLALPCLFQKARIKLKAINERLRLPGPPIALRCIESLTYLAVGVSHVAKRSVFRTAYLSKAVFHRPQGGLFREAYFALACLAPAYFAPGVFHVAQRSVFRAAYLSKAVFHRPQGGLFRAAYFALACLAPAYFAPGVFHPAKRSVFREAYFQNKATWIGTYSLILTLLCSSISPTLSKSAQSPPEPSLHRSAVPVSPHSGDTHRGGVARPDTLAKITHGEEFSELPIYSSSLSTLDGGPTLRSSDIRHRTALLSPISGLPPSNKEPASLRAFARSDDPIHWESVLSTVKASDIRHRTSDIKLNFGLIIPDQDMGAGEGTSCLQPAPFPVFTNPTYSSREVSRQNTNAQSLVSNVTRAEHLADESREVRSMLLESSSNLASPSPALIYGEIINPDSLGPLVLSSSPYFVDANSQFGQSIQEINPIPGEFFDGVLNKAVRKFKVQVDLSDRLGYFSLHIGYRALLENFLIIPGDSLKVNLDLQNFQISFAGTNAAFYELQYLLAREADRQVFDAPRQLILSPSSAILTKEENVAKWEFFKTQFGSQLKVVSGTKESLQNQIRQLAFPQETLSTRLEYLDFFKGKMDSGLWDYIRLDLMSKHYRGVTASIRNFSLDLLEKEYSEAESDSITEKLIWELENLKGLESSDQVKLVSQGFLGMEIERQTLLAVLKKISFLTQLESQYTGELADRIKAGFLSRFLNQYPNPEDILSTYLNGMSHEPWMARVESLKRSTIPGDPFLELTMRNLNGDQVNSSSFKGKPTLLYVYFSTCSHSADYFDKYLFPIYQATRDLGYQMIALSVDEDQDLWKSRLDKFSDPSITNLNISGFQKKAFVQGYEIFGFPKVFLLDASGRIAAFKIEGSDLASLKANVLDKLDLKSSNQSFPNP